jgi:hypothetical protein
MCLTTKKLDLVGEYNQGEVVLNSACRIMDKPMIRVGGGGVTPPPCIRPECNSINLCLLLCNDTCINMLRTEFVGLLRFILIRDVTCLARPVSQLIIVV